MRCENGRGVALAFAAGLAVRLTLALALPLEPSWDGVLYERAAAQLAAGDGYTVRMLDPDWPWVRPTAFYPPGWPAVLAAWKLLALRGPFDLVLQAILGALAIPLAAALAHRAGGGRAAVATAWLVALWPGGALASASWMTEPLFTVALLVALIPLVGPAPRSRSALTGALAVSALAFGLAAYVRPTALALAPLALAARGWTLGPRARPSGSTPPAGAHRGWSAPPLVPGSGSTRLADRGWSALAREPARRLLTAAGAGAFAALSFVPLAPWMARNAEAVDGVVVSSNGGANLYVGTLYARFHRIPGSLDCPDGPRELTRDHCRTERALARIADDPVAWSILGGLKLAHTFGYEASPALQLGAGLGWSHPESGSLVRALAALCSAFWLALLVVALAGLRRPAARTLPLWASLAALAATHFVFLGGDRYHLPLVPLVAVLSVTTHRRSRLQ